MNAYRWLVVIVAAALIVWLFVALEFAGVIT